MDKINEIIHVELPVNGANCTSCAIAVEHFGEHLDGVEDIWVDKQRSCIQLDYNGDPEILLKIKDFVAKIGYNLTLPS